MSEDNNIFNDDSKPADPAATPEVVTPPTPTPAAIPDSLKELIGEGKKYATVEAALSSVAPSQTHIQKLEAELRELREKTKSQESLEETYETVQEMIAKLKETPPTSVDEATIAGLLDRQLTAREQVQRHAANGMAVKQALEGKWGDKAREVYEQKAEELDISTSFLNDLARKSPKAALELFGIKSGQTKGTPTMGSVNTETLNQHKQPTPQKSIMQGAKTSDIIAAWRATSSE